MENFDLLIKRNIFLYLNAKDKIKTLALVSKSWRELVFSGYAWESLFDQNYDKSWKISKVKKELFKMFSHFKGILSIYIRPGGYCIEHLENHA